MTAVAEAEAFPHKLVVVVRRDLKLSPGKLAVQVAHASVDCALKASKRDAKTFDRWHRGGQKKVVVRAEGLADLHQLKSEAESLGLTTALISDAGLTEVPPGTVTVLGVGPGPNTDVDRVTGHLGLL